MGIFGNLFGSKQPYRKMSASDLNVLVSNHREIIADINKATDKEKMAVGTGVMLGMGYLADNFGDPQGDKLVDASIGLQRYAAAWHAKGNDPLATGVGLVARLLLAKTTQDANAIRELSGDLTKLKDGVQIWASAQSTQMQSTASRPVAKAKEKRWMRVGDVLTNRETNESFAVVRHSPNSSREVYKSDRG